MKMRWLVILVLVMLSVIDSASAENRPRNVPVLMYHKVDTLSYDNGWVSAANFEKQLAFLREHGFNSISLADLTDLPDNPILITFDDGWWNAYTVAVPLLEKYDYRGTFFVITGAIGEDEATRRYSPAYGANPKVDYLIWPEILDMASRDHDIESHTVLHPYLTQLSADKLSWELAESKAEIEARTGKPVDALAYPMGDWNLTVAEATAAAGYLTAVTTDSGVANTTTSWTYALPRLAVLGSLTLEQFSHLVMIYPDIPVDFWAGQEIKTCVEKGIISLYADGSYLPNGEVTRAEMAAYIARALAGHDWAIPAGPFWPTFKDVSRKHWAYKYIEYCHSKGIVFGYSDGIYQPEGTITRDQLAVYLARALAGASGVPEFYGKPGFSDIPADFWAYQYIEYCHTIGIVNGYEDGTYQPLRLVTRDQMAVYITRAFHL